MAEERILVLGVGNVLMRDEGVGPRIVEALTAGYSLPDNVRVVDAGTLGFAIVHLLRDVDYVLVADAVDGTGHP
ncbi:MAG: hydrogenase maturation protease, partial [Fimbriimonadales bacterium]